MGVHANEETATSVKYRLVEAEEVDANAAGKATPAAPAAAPKSKGKGKVNWTQLPLDGGDATSERSSEDANGSESRAGRGRGRGRGPRSGRGGAYQGDRRPYYDSNGVYYNGVYVPNPDPKVTAQWAKSQIEFYFSPENLVRDIFLRQHMDVDGFVPLAFVGSFQAVFSVHQDYPSLLEAMKYSQVIELDEENEKIRLRENWSKWLWPNAEGGYGVPRYIKVREEDLEQEQQ
ncbi:hypothetical protein P43SY_011723 [Pythium insidiosum]|uniref:HTH La-type RNA-binding domain-containing protein n=1 Tax=Pythium insidiosum TaxID=114742 RepID=A0AAD5Q1U7_PYTIN|nr:hypothetical protein P43SY_011723 [Pythium insidiosum]